MSLGIHVVNNQIVVRRAAGFDGIALGNEGVPCCCEEEEILDADGVCTECPLMGLTGQYYNVTPPSGTPVLTRQDAELDFTWDGSPGPGVNADNFSVVWTGRIQAPVTGTYTFYTTTANGVQLSIESYALLIDELGPHAETTHTSTTIDLTAGQTYLIEVRLDHTTGDARMLLEWSYPGQGQTKVPARNLAHLGDAANAPPGLSADYYRGVNLEGAVAGSATLFTSGVTKTWTDPVLFPGTFDPIADSDPFSARITGFIYWPTDEAITFYISAADGVRLYIDDELIVDQWVDQSGSTEHTASPMTKPPRLWYPITIEMYDRAGTASVGLAWSSADFAKVTVASTNITTGIINPNPAQRTITLDGIVIPGGCIAAVFPETIHYQVGATTVSGTFCMTEGKGCVWEYRESPGTTVVSTGYTGGGCTGTATPQDFVIQETIENGIRNISISVGKQIFATDVTPAVDSPADTTVYVLDCDEEYTAENAIIQNTINTYLGHSGTATVVPGPCE